VNPRTGEAIHPGYPVGAEMLLAQNGGVSPANVAVELYKNMVMQDPNWDWKTMDFDTVIAKAEKEASSTIDVPANLNGFLNHGGKLMIYIGGAEQKNPKGTIDFYKTVLRNDPDKQDQIRLFVNPGVGHCGGGTGCDTFEKLETIANWVESGKAPDWILSSKVTGGKTVRTRPLCAYPAVAKYKGSGNLDDAASFECAR
jgi:feruloyl esterase